MRSYMQGGGGEGDCGRRTPPLNGSRTSLRHVDSSPASIARGKGRPPAALPTPPSPLDQSLDPITRSCCFTAVYSAYSWLYRARAGRPSRAGSPACSRQRFATPSFHCRRSLKASSRGGLSHPGLGEEAQGTEAREGRGGEGTRGGTVSPLHRVESSQQVGSEIPARGNSLLRWRCGNALGGGWRDASLRRCSCALVD